MNFARSLLIIVALPLSTILLSSAVPTEAASDKTAADSTRLAIVWTSGDPEVAHRMALMYAHAAKQSKWFDEIRVVVWGPSARLLAADKDLQAKIGQMMKDGVDVKACVVCADSYGVSDKLRSLDIEVAPMGKPLTEMLKGDWKVMTF